MTKLFSYKIDHILFWILTIGFHSYTSASLIDRYDFDIYLAEVVVRNALLAIVIYLNIYITLDFFDKKRSALGLLVLFVSLVGYALVKNFYDFTMYEQPLYGPSSLFYNISIASFYLGFCLALHFTKQWYLQREQLRKVELEKLHTELDYLKSQINPHFVFNSINTIYFQIDKQNNVARETLSKFSEMLRYQLYECNGHEIPIEREVGYLRNYVELQRMRKDENYEIEFSCTEALRNFAIPPLLLIPFVENAFKHASHFSNKNNSIKIDLDFRDGYFYFRVFNTKDTLAKHDDKGIGLKNTKRRLQLLFPDAHSLSVKEGSDTFEVNVSFHVNTTHPART